MNELEPNKGKELSLNYNFIVRLCCYPLWWFPCWLCDGPVIFAPFFWLPLPNQDRWLRGTLNSQFHASEHRYFDPFHQSLCLRALERVSVVWIIQPVKLSIHRSVARYWNIIWFQLHAAGLTETIYYHKHLAHRQAIFLCSLKVDNQVEHLTNKKQHHITSYLSFSYYEHSQHICLLSSW